MGSIEQASGIRRKWRVRRWAAHPLAVRGSRKCAENASFFADNDRRRRSLRLIPATKRKAEQERRRREGASALTPAFFAGEKERNAASR